MNSNAMLSTDMPSTHRKSSIAPSHLPRMISLSRMGEVSSNSMVPVRFSSAISRMVIMGIRNSVMVPAKPSSGRMIMIVDVHGLLLAHHLRLQAHAHEVARGDVEGESEDQREQRPSADRRWARRSSS